MRRAVGGFIVGIALVVAMTWNGIVFQNYWMGKIASPEQQASTTSDSPRGSTAPIIWTQSFPASQVVDSALELNSEQWLSGLRLGNVAHETSLEFVNWLIAKPSLADILQLDDPSPSILSLSLCAEQSRFLNWNHEDNKSTRQDVAGCGREPAESGMQSDASREQKDLAFRMVYLAIHEHQHRHARAEAVTRLKLSKKESFGATTDTFDQTNLVGMLDFECPDAKFIVTHVPEYGLGASIRFAAAHILSFGLITDRVALLVNSVDVGPKPMKEVWPLASCHRHDLQCVFMPLSPCVVTEQELKRAPVLTNKEVISLRSSGKLDEKYANERVIVLPNWLRQARGPIGLREAVWNIVQSMYKEVQSIARTNENSATTTTTLLLVNDEQMESLQQTIQDKDSDQWLVHHAATLFILRPNLTYKKKLSDASMTIFPRDFDPRSAIGLPIRSSDKCHKESECLPFDDYMAVVSSFKERVDVAGCQTHDSIVLTSESLPVLEARKTFEANDSFPFHFITNEDDVHQGSGTPSLYGLMSQLNATADDVMLSTLVAVQMQLVPDATMGNCCSHFHELIRELLGRGCGAAASHRFECLNENEDEKFRICCYWSKTEECKTKREEGTLSRRFRPGSDLLHPEIKKKREKSAKSGRKQRKKNKDK